MKIRKGIVGGLVTGIAATPIALYQLAFKRVYPVASGTSTVSQSQKMAIVHDSNNAANIILAFGGLLLAILIVYVSIGLYADYKISKDI